jgi:hypothetical protein
MRRSSLSPAQTQSWLRIGKCVCGHMRSKRRLTTGTLLGNYYQGVQASLAVHLCAHIAINMCMSV